MTSLLFPCLITTFCKAMKVHIDEWKDRKGKESGVIYINRISDAIVPPVVLVQEQNTGDISQSHPSMTPPGDAAESSTPQFVSQDTPALSAPTQPTPATLVVPKLGLLALHANKKVDQLLRTLPNLIKQALTPMQTFVIEIQ